LGGADLEGGASINMPMATSAAAENTQLPPGRPDSRCHIRYVEVAETMSTYLTQQ
jgi:hypothetical protein